jgi:C4-dicarboxylate transporter DctM subunit
MIGIMLVVFFATMLIGVPMAYSAGLASAVYIFMADIPIAILAQRIFVSCDNFTMLAIPLFIISGDLMNNGGITKSILVFSKSLVGHIRGNLAYVTILANMMFAAMSGSANAACACMGSMMIPSMKEEKYSPGFACAVTASSSILGPIIPPSIIFVIYGSITGTSVAALLLGGILPGLLLGGLYMIVSYIIAKKRNYPVGEKITWSERGSAFIKAIPALAAPLIIVGGILSGIFTATEAGAITALYAIIIGLVNKELTFKKFIDSLLSASTITAAILLITGTAQAFAWILTSKQIPQQLASSIISFSSSVYSFYFIVIIALLLIGCFIIETASVPILAPLFAPLAAEFGIDPVQFGVIFVLMVCVGSLTPPVGSMLFVVSKVGETPVSEVIRELLPFFLVIIISISLLIIFPPIITFLPSLLGK